MKQFYLATLYLVVLAALSAYFVSREVRKENSQESAKPVVQVSIAKEGKSTQS